MEGTQAAAMATPGNLGSSVLASKTKTKKKHFVAQKVKLFRASDPLLSVLMWGVNHSVRLGLRQRSLSSSSSLPCYCSCCQARSSGPTGARAPELSSCRGASASPSPGARPLHRAARAPLGPPLDLGPAGCRRGWNPFCI